jgi:hypothetical protein
MGSKPKPAPQRSTDESTRTTGEGTNQGYQQFLSSLTDEQKKRDHINQQKQEQILVEFAKYLTQISGE